MAEPDTAIIGIIVAGRKKPLRSPRTMATTVYVFYKSAYAISRNTVE